MNSWNAKRVVLQRYNVANGMRNVSCIKVTLPTGFKGQVTFPWLWVIFMVSAIKPQHTLKIIIPKSDETVNGKIVTSFKNKQIISLQCLFKPLFHIDVHPMCSWPTQLTNYALFLGHLASKGTQRPFQYHRHCFLTDVVWIRKPGFCGGVIFFLIYFQNGSLKI